MNDTIIIAGISIVLIIVLIILNLKREGIKK